MINPRRHRFKSLKKIEINALISDLQRIIEVKGADTVIIARYVDIEAVRFYTDIFDEQDITTEDFYTGLPAWVLMAHLKKQKEIFNL